MLLSFFINYFKGVIMANLSQTIEQRLDKIESLLINITNSKKVMNLDEVADYTGYSKSFIYKLTSTGGIPCYKPQGKQIFFEKEEIDNWLLQNRKATNDEIQSQAATYVALNKGGVR